METSTVIALRPATAADREFCYRLHKAAMGVYITAIWGWDEQVQRGFHARAFDPGRWQIITADGADIGMINVEYRPGEIYLARIEVSPDHQGHGVGTSLISALLDEARRGGQDLVLDVLTVNRRARALYQRLGLTEMARHGDNNIKITMRSAGPPRVVSPAARRRALRSATGHLRCPVCTGPVRLGDTELICDNGHSFDIARQGYVNLTAGRANPGTGDTAAMVAARDQFLGRGHYRPLAHAVRSLAARHEPAGPGLVVDLAGGTGYYLAATLDALPHRTGLCVDLSTAALRRAARAHPRAAAAGADVWQPLPLAAGSAAVLLSVFGPRNAAEIDRVLVAGGALIIASPGGAHLRELRRPLGLIGVDQRKSERLADAFGNHAKLGSQDLTYRLDLDHTGLTALAAMGPSARHITPQALADRIHALPSPATVTVDLQISVYRRR